MRIDVRRMGNEDVVSYICPTLLPCLIRSLEVTTVPTQSSPHPPRPVLQRIIRLLLKLPAKLVESLQVVLPLSIFFIKFLEWWYSPNSPARALAQMKAGPLIPPPKMLKPHPQGVLKPDEMLQYNVCPICRQTITNAHATPSGYVFCYKCVFQALERDEKCPVTLVPTRTWMLRKVLM